MDSRPDSSAANQAGCPAQEDEHRKTDTENGQLFNLVRVWGKASGKVILFRAISLEELNFRAVVFRAGEWWVGEGPVFQATAIRQPVIQETQTPGNNNQSVAISETVEPATLPSFKPIVER